MNGIQMSDLIEFFERRLLKLAQEGPETNCPPETFERMLMFLDHILWKLIGMSGEVVPVKYPYIQYLDDTGEGGAKWFTTNRVPPTELSPEQLAVLCELSEFWVGYLNHRTRTGNN